MKHERLKKHWLILIIWFILPIASAIFIEPPLSFRVLWIWGGIFFVVAIITTWMYAYKYRKKFKENESQKYLKWDNEGAEDFFQASLNFRIDKWLQNNKKQQLLIEEHEKDESIAPCAKKLNELRHFVWIAFAVFIFYPFVYVIVVAFILSVVGTL